jgi:hypothetical protein
VPAPDATIMKRLGYARLLYQQAVTRSFSPPPLSFSSVLNFHDVMEYLFILAVAHVGGAQGIDPKKPFSENVKKLVAPDGGGVSSVDALTRVAHDRNGFKHNGSIPDAEQVEQARRDATMFLEGNCLRFFGIPFAEVSMLHLVPQHDVRVRLHAGRAAADADDLSTAMSEVALAFDWLIHEWGQGKHGPGSVPRTATFDLQDGRHPAQRRISATPRPADSSTQHAIESIASATIHEFEEMDKELEAVRHLLRIQISGVDMQRYLRFAMIVPQVNVALGGARSTSHMAGQFHYTPENYAFCEMFVVDSALSLGEGDFTMWMPQTFGDWGRAEAAMAANGGRLPHDMT